MIIEKYEFGTMLVGKREHHQDLKIIGEKVIAGWWRKEGHLLQIEDVDDILAAKPEILVVGMGYPGRMQVSDSLRSALAGANIQLIAEPTRHAVANFNLLSSRGRTVAGAFHLTC
jgi:hypothetical protein